MESEEKLIIALDISPKMIKCAKRRLARFGVGNVCLIVADIRKLPIRENIADAIVSLGVLKHIPGNPPSTLEVLKEMARVAKTNCRVYINDLPHLFHPEAWMYKIAIIFWRKFLKRFTTGTYIFNPWQLLRALKLAGAKDLVFYGVGWKFPFVSIARPFKRYYYIDPINPYAPAKRQPIIRFNLMEISFTLNTR